MIQNIGADAVSSHDMTIDTSCSNVVARFEFDAFEAENELDANNKNQNDRLLEREVYKIQVRHILSPLKSWISKGRSH